LNVFDPSTHSRNSLLKLDRARSLEDLFIAVSKNRKLLKHALGRANWSIVYKQTLIDAIKGLLPQKGSGLTGEIEALLAPFTLKEGPEREAEQVDFGRLERVLKARAKERAAFPTLI